MPTTVTVIRDGGVRARGYRDGDAIVYDWGFSWQGGEHEQRSFVLLDTGFQINQPVIFPEQQRGWWYCDLVRVVDDGHTVHVDDQAGGCGRAEQQQRVACLLGRARQRAQMVHRAAFVGVSTPDRL